VILAARRVAALCRGAAQLLADAVRRALRLRRRSRHAARSAERWNARRIGNADTAQTQVACTLGISPALGAVRRSTGTAHARIEGTAAVRRGGAGTALRSAACSIRARDASTTRSARRARLAGIEAAHTLSACGRRAGLPTATVRFDGARVSRIRAGVTTACGKAEGATRLSPATVARGPAPEERRAACAPIAARYHCGPQNVRAARPRVVTHSAQLTARKADVPVWRGRDLAALHRGPIG
jgi:hypothetical protein